MRILEVTHYMPPHMGGIERVAQSLVTGLSARGHAVRWIAAATPANAGHDGALVRVPAWNVLEERAGVPYPLWSPVGLASLDREVRSADVVHAHDCLYMGSAMAAAACAMHARPLLVTQHVGYVPFGATLDAVQRVAYQTLGRIVLSRAERRVACSAHVPEYFARLGYRGAFRVIPNAIDETKFVPPTLDDRARARSAWGVRSDARVVLFVGRLVAKKAITRVCSAQESLARDGIVLVVVGDGPLREAVSRAPATVHHPAVPPERMPELYALADAFVLPSRGEGLPLSVQEAMMTGLPVVVSDDPSYLANLGGAPGVSFVRDDADLATAIRSAMEPSREGGASVAWARERWGGAQFIDRYEALMRELAEGRA